MSANPFSLVLRSLRHRLGLEATASPDALLLERFVLAGDESAFAALVERHGALVWGVCRRVVGDVHAAEDAFQATWIVLSRKARSVKTGDSLPGWLYRVAYRLALEARARPVASLEEMPGEASGPEHEASLNELRQVIDEEVSRLPEKYRLPVVLCFLEGRTHAEAAAELGWPIGTVAGRVARAKDLLHARLTRRGVAPAVLPLALAATGMVPPVGAKQAGAAATALAKAMLAVEAQRRWVVGGAFLLLLCVGVTAAVLVVLRPPDQSREAPARPVPPVPPETKVAVLPVLRIQMAHEQSVLSVAYSPDSKVIASASEDETVKLWDVTTGKELATLMGHNGPVESVAYSPDGKTLASGGYDLKTGLGEVVLWDVATGKALTNLKGHTHRMECLAWSPDGKTLASGSMDHTIKLWDVAARKEQATLRLEQRRGLVSCFAWSPDGKMLASGGRVAWITLWDVASGKEKFKLELPHTMVYPPKDMLEPWYEEFKPYVGYYTASSVAYSPDGKTLASAVRDGTIRLWDVATGKQLATLKGRTLEGGPVGYSPDGKTLASQGDKQTIKLWDLKTYTELTTLKGAGAVESLAWSPDGNTLVSGSSDGVIRVWK